MAQQVCACLAGRLGCPAFEGAQYLAVFLLACYTAAIVEVVEKVQLAIAVC